MSKKMHDILPPLAKIKSESPAKALVKKSTKRKLTPPVREVFQSPVPVVREIKKPKKIKITPWKGVLIFSAVLVVGLGVLAFFKLPKADIEIWPKLETLTLDQTLTADAGLKMPDFTQKFIPAEFLEVIKDGQQDFPATGLAANDGLATGMVRIYNKINPAQSYGALKKGTQLLSDSNKLFLTTKAVTVPAAKNGTPGFVDVLVQAAQAGADYNIGASKFSLPKLNGTSYYYGIYGASFVDMSGGYTGKVKKVTEDDLAMAKEVLTKQLLEQAQALLKAKLADNQILLDGATVQNVITASASLKSGAIADNFTQSAQVKVVALVFKKQDLDEFVKNDIRAKVPAGSTFLEQSIVVHYQPKAIDMGGKKETITLQATANIYQDINTGDLVDLFGGKSADQIKEVADQLHKDSISELKVNFWPFWVHKAPNDKSRIKVHLNF